jgi:hypothetical protein
VKARHTAETGAFTRPPSHDEELALHAHETNAREALPFSQLKPGAKAEGVRRSW